MFVSLNFQLWSWQDQVTSIILVTLTREPDYERKFRLSRDKRPINRDISPCNKPAKTTPICFCYKLCFTYIKMLHFSVLSFSTILPLKELKTCYKQNKYVMIWTLYLQWRNEYLITSHNQLLVCSILFLTTYLIGLNTWK